MLVFVVIEGVDYEGANSIGVYTTKEKAEERVKKEKAFNQGPYYYIIEEHELDD